MNEILGEQEIGRLIHAAAITMALSEQDPVEAVKVNMAPSKTPRPVIGRLQREIAAALQRPELVTLMARDGSEPVASSPEQFGQHIRGELEKWRKVITETGIRAK